MKDEVWYRGIIMKQKHLKEYLKKSEHYVLHHKVKKVQKKIPKPIPKSEHTHGYTWRELTTFLTKLELKKLNKWLHGQTCTMNDKREMVFYTWDIERFINMVRKGVPTYWD